MHRKDSGFFTCSEEMVLGEQMEPLGQYLFCVQPRFLLAEHKINLFLGKKKDFCCPDPSWEKNYFVCV